MSLPTRIEVHSSVSSVAQSCLTFCGPWTAACQASLSINNTRSLLKLMSMSWWFHSTISSSIVPFSSCLQSFPASGSFQMSQLFTSDGQSIGVSASQSVLPMNIQDWLDLLAVQGTLKSLLQYHSSKASILRRSAFLIVQLSHPYMNTGKTIALTRPLLAKECVCFLICCLGWS